MHQKYALLLPALLLLAACTYEPSVTQVTLPVRSTTTITISELRWFSGSFTPTGRGVSVFSGQPSVLALDQDPTLASTSVTLRGLMPGTADIKASSDGV